ncbi:HAD family hydrolase [Nocardioides marmoraquaticus]
MHLACRAVLLDMDGTLVDSTAAVDRIWTDWAREHDLDPAEVISVVHGRQGHESMAELLPDRPHADNLADNASLLSREVAETEGIVEIAGATVFLEALAGTRRAMVTSASADLARSRMGAAGLTPLPVQVVAEDVTASKPHPEGFLAGAAALGVAAADCVVFEDSGAGVAAARAAGMRVVGVGPVAADHDPDVHVTDLTSVRVEPGPDGIVLTFG